MIRIIKLTQQRYRLQHALGVKHFITGCYSVVKQNQTCQKIVN